MIILHGNNALGSAMPGNVVAFLKLCLSITIDMSAALNLLLSCICKSLAFPVIQ